MIDGPLRTVLGRLEAARRSGDGWAARCPGHDDSDPSLEVSEGEDGRVLLCCHAGCTTEDVVVAIGLKLADLFPPRESNGGRRIDATYDYVDEQGDLLYQVVRFEPKDFRQRRPDGKGGWIWKLGDARRVLYRLPEVIDAVKAGRAVYVAEGEKDVDALVRAGVTATCCPGGAGKWAKVPDAADVLAGATVVVIADKDETGAAHAAEVGASLRAHGCTVSLVTAASGKDAADHLGAGRTIEEFVEEGEEGEDEEGDVEDGDDLHLLLDELQAHVGRYVALPSPAAAVAVVLWVVHAHAMRAWESTPRLAVLSPEMRSGKTRLLEILELLVPRPMRAVNCSPSALYRSVAEHQPTVLVDEADAIFGAKASSDHEDLRALLNAGHRRGAVVYRAQPVGQRVEVQALPVYSAVAIAGIGDLPPTIVDRAVVVRMRRRAPGEHVEPFRYRKVRPPAEALRARVAAWTEAHADRLGAAEPDMPVTDRAADVWEPLVAVADAAGGDWPARARAAAVELTEAVAVDEPTLGTRLLADCRTVFTAEAVDKVTSASLAEKLAKLDESPWGDLYGKVLDARGLARRLKAYDIRPTSVWIEDRSHRGYHIETFADAWQRYLPDPPHNRDERDVGGERDEKTPSDQGHHAHHGHHGSTGRGRGGARDGTEHDRDGTYSDEDAEEQAVRRLLDAFDGAELVDDAEDARLP